jgi:signal transduction histidine kinase
LLDKISGSGAYTMVACSSYAAAWYEEEPRRKAQTYFTKYLADLVQTGIAGEPAELRLRVLFRRLHEKLASDKRPMPEDRNIDDGGDFVFAYNATPPPVHANFSSSTPTQEQAEHENLKEILINLSRRSQSLIERQLSLIDALEQSEEDPERLSSLFRLDHLGTRMRRNNENLLVLGGYEISRRWSQPIPLVDLMRAAVSEIEQYERVVLNVQPGIAVDGSAVNDVVHLVAEIVENATTFSPQDTQVFLSGERLAAGGVILDITDNGVGMSDKEMSHVNRQLDHPPLVDAAVSRRMGLFVVGRLAVRPGLRRVP